MALLLFEIWEHPGDQAIGMSQVSRAADESRQRAEPDSILRHSFYAESDFEAFKAFNDWCGYGRWMPEPDWTERRFSDAEAAEQLTYLDSRTI